MARTRLTPEREGELYDSVLDLLREVGYDSLFAFCYSPRTHTPARDFPDQIPDEVKRERLAQVFKLQAAIGLEANRARIGRREGVLVERGRSEKEGSLASGRTRQNRWVHFPVDAPEIGSEVNSEITEAFTYYLKGKIYDGREPVTPPKY